MTNTINYGELMHDAMRGVMAKLLQMTAENGLVGEHHFYITFDTTHDDVKIADWMQERYPEDMTIVLQHWFDDLVVTDDNFEITLNFGENPERLIIPFDAIKTFVDPSVEFGLRFENADIEPLAGDESPMIELDDEIDQSDEKPSGDAEVVSLDSFRK